MNKPAQHDDHPVTPQTPVRFTDPVPDEVDVVIVGGGVIGVFSALSAHRSGLRVALIEKGVIAGEQSSRNWGWIRQQGRDEAELPIMMDAIGMWRDIDQQTNGRVGFVQGGLSYLASTQARLAELEQWLAIASRYQLDSRMLSRQEQAALIQQPESATGCWLGALHTPSDGRVEPWRAVPAVAALAQSAGVSVTEQCAVRALEIAGGQLQGVITEHGLVRCSQVVLAGGAWSSLLLRRHGIDLPQLSVRQSVARTGPMPAVLDGNAADETFAIRRRQDGGYTLAVSDRNEHFIGRDSFRHLRAYIPMIRKNYRSTPLRLGMPSDYPDNWRTARHWAADEQSPFEKCRVLHPEASERSVHLMRERFAQRFPQLGQPPILNAWAGMIDTMPDVVPVVDRVPSVPALLVATGMSGHGMGIGPAFGQIIARLLNGQAPGYDMTRFRFGRFTDGSSSVPGPHV